MSQRVHQLPSKIEGYLATLNQLYKRTKATLLREIVVNGLPTVQEEWEYDNLDGGTLGHAITLRLQSDLFVEALEQKYQLEATIAQDLNKIDNTSNEHVAAVFIEMEPPQDERWRENTDVFQRKASERLVTPDSLKRIWGEGAVRVFLSHKSSVRGDVSKLKSKLSGLGIASFVAHEDIQPTQEWQLEIERALSSMSALVALLTIDYHDSNWTDQEVGVAIGRGVPLILVRVGKDPYGLMGKNQGLGGCNLSEPATLASKIFQLLYKRLPDPDALFECANVSYAASSSWEDSGWRLQNGLSVFESLREKQIERVLETYRDSEENKHSFRSRGILIPLLNKWTGKEWRLTNDGDIQVRNVVNDITF